VLIDDGFGDLGCPRDLLDGAAIVAVLGEYAATDLQQLAASLNCGQPLFLFRHVDNPRIDP